MDARTAFAWALVVALGAVTWLLVEPFLSWLLLTGLIAFVLFPIHRRLEPRIGSRVSAGLLAVGVAVLTVAALALGATIVVQRGAELLEGVSRSNLVQRADQLLAQYVGAGISVEPLARRGADRLSSYVGGSASSILSAGLHAFLGFLLLTFVLYYLLKDGRRFVAWLERVVPLESGVREELLGAADDMTWAVLKGHVLVAAIQGAVAGVSLFVTGVPEAAVLTAAMMVLALIPVIGVAPVLGGAVIFLFANGRTLSAAFVIVWGFTTVAITDDYLRAYLIDRQTEMHSAVIFVGIVGGTYLLGPIGLFIGPILIGLFKVTVEVLGVHYGVIPRA
ncbi:AI-2E family transporter [Natronoarchaeum rubrum]|uniref:AI-2E family transporter n=1 Tax=Natronoarchaeum rubrum TaxID=755311 RepID=UPI0021137379|nr:AI-2E family transporter [Natronoarchaeum rubrum]